MEPHQNIKAEETRRTKEDDGASIATGAPPEDGASAAAAAAATSVRLPPSSPFHVLMAPDGEGDGQGRDHGNKLTRRAPPEDAKTRRDFVSKRRRAFQMMSRQKPQDDGGFSMDNGNKSGDCDHLWTGVSPIEKSLALCCENMQADDGEGGSFAIPGALSKNQILRFLCLLAMHCNDLSSRVLALAILERSLQEDRLEETEKREQTAAASDSPLEEPPMKRPRQCVIESSQYKKSSTANSTSVNNGCNHNPVLRYGRTQEFLAAGGLRILQRWLSDATTPVPVQPTKAPPTSNISRRSQSAPSKTTPTTSASPTKASPTVYLLVPLLKFLRDIPFDRQLLIKHKIIKQIRDLRKEINSVAAQLPDEDSESKESGAISTHHLYGGLPVLDVKQALDSLISSWEEKAKIPAQPIKTTPLMEGLYETLLDRSSTLTKRLSGDEDKPEWLSKLEEAQKTRDSRKRSGGNSNNHHARTADLAKRERQNERAAMMREDLQKTQEERKRYLAKLRELKRTNFSNGNDRLPQAHYVSKSKKSVRWKDGLGAAARTRDRTKLEQVFLLFPTSCKTEEEESKEAPPEDPFLL